MGVDGSEQVEAEEIGKRRGEKGKRRGRGGRGLGREWGRRRGSK